ncbi:hypothetical protein ACTACG_04800 [Pseudomonas syringae]
MQFPYLPDTRPGRGLDAYVSRLKEIFTGIRFLDDTVSKLPEIAADTLLRGVAMYRNFLFLRDKSAGWQFIFIGAEAVTIPINRFAFYVRSAFSDNLE